jgi:hypothetical protein
MKALAALAGAYLLGWIAWRGRTSQDGADFIRDVGVEGSNPFTPTIIFPRVFSHVDAENAATVSAENHSRCQSW